MNIARITAVYLGTRPEYKGKIVLLAGLDDQQRLISGQWMGYMLAQGVTFPFVLDGDGTKFIWGPLHGVQTQTNIGQKRLALSEMFTLYETEFDPEVVYKVVTVHSLT